MACILLGAEKDNTLRINNYLYNSSFELGQTLSDALAWHRMPDIAYVITPDSGWDLDDVEAFHGKRSLRAKPGAKPLTIPFEIWAQLPEKIKSPWVFSLYMKAAKDNFPCKIEIGNYNGLKCKYLSKQIRLTTQWKRYEFVVGDFHGKPRRGAMQGPMNIRLSPDGNGQVNVDSLQWESSDKATGYTSGVMVNGRFPSVSAVKLFDEINKKNEKLKTLLPKDTGSFTEKKQTNSLTIPLIAVYINSYKKNLAKGVPVATGVPFKSGSCYKDSKFSLFDSKDNEIPFQSYVLSRWPIDKSVRSLGIFFETDLFPGNNHFTLQSKPGKVITTSHAPIVDTSGRIWKVQLNNCAFLIDPTSGDLWSKENSGSILKAHGLDGKIFSSSSSPGIITKLEYNGPIYASVLKKGILTSEDGEGLLEFDCRMHFFHNRPGVEVELCIINPQEKGTVIVRDLFLQVPASGSDTNMPLSPKDKNTFLEYYSPEDKEFYCTAFDSSLNSTSVLKVAERSSVWAAKDKKTISVCNPWKKHPSMVKSTENELEAYFWPSGPSMGVFFSRGMSVTRRFVFLENSGSPQDAVEKQIIFGILPGKKYFSKTDLFMMPLGYTEPEKYPFLEKILKETREQNRFSKKGIEQRKFYGLFDYGDVTGDGGWSNLESFVDYTAIINALCSNSFSILHLALDGAEHYRDMDTDQNRGLCRVHSRNHIIGPGVFNHSWPQGFYAHYLLTGSRRSLDVSLLTGTAMLQMPVDHKTLQGSRALSRYMLQLTDLYALCGAKQLKNRFFEKLDYAEKKLAERDSKDRTIFPAFGRLDPYQVWYGIIAMAEMYLLTENEKLLKSIHRELGASLNMDFYERDITQLFPEVSPKKGWPIALALTARHRGSFFYPLMNFYSRITDNPKWVKLAAKTAYTDFIRGKRVKTHYEIFKLSALNSGKTRISEDKALTEARKLIYQAAATTLLNGDFSASKIWFENWDPFDCERPMGWDSLIGKWDIDKALPMKERIRQYRASRTISPWQFYRRNLASLDNEVFHNAPPSLRINLDSSWVLGSRCFLGTARIRIKPGKWKLSGSFRYGEGIKKPVTLRMILYPQTDGRYICFQFPLPDEARQVESSTPEYLKSATSITPDEIVITAPDSKKWQNFSCTFECPEKAIMYPRFLIYLQKGSPKGNFYLDDFKLNPWKPKAAEK